MIDENMKPWLLEVNHSSSFHCDSPLDAVVKKHVILDTLNILNVSCFEKSKYLAQRMNMMLGFKKKNSFDKSPSAAAASDDQHTDKTRAYEDSHKGGYVRIYPVTQAEDQTDYAKLLRISEQLWKETTTATKKATCASQLHGEIDSPKKPHDGRSTSLATASHPSEKIILPHLQTSRLITCSLIAYERCVVRDNAQERGESQ